MTVISHDNYLQMTINKTSPSPPPHKRRCKNKVSHFQKLLFATKYFIRRHFKSYFYDLGSSKVKGKFIHQKKNELYTSQLISFPIRLLMFIRDKKKAGFAVNISSTYNFKDFFLVNLDYQGSLRKPPLKKIWELPLQFFSCGGISSQS